MPKKEKKDNLAVEEIIPERQAIRQVYPESPTIEQKKSERTTIFSLINSYAGLLSIVVVVVTSIYGAGKLSNQVSQNEKEYDSLEDKLDNVSVSINEGNVKSEKRLSTLETHYEDMSKNIDTLNDMLKPVVAQKYEPTDDAIKTIDSVFTKYSGEDFSEPKWTCTDVIARDDNGKEYTAAELVDKKIILPYHQNGQDVIFYGQYSENNYWDGNCIVDVYSKGKLILIMDANYDDGKLLDYKQVIPYQKDNVWIVSKMVSSGDINTGESWRYYKGSEYKENFDFDEVTTDNVINVAYFSAMIDTDLEGYYNGKTSDGSYNDDSGKAYLIKYGKDKYVNTLYQGKFVDGEFDDASGNAWYITRNKNNQYMYYIGKFKNGNTCDKTNKNNFIFDVSINQINGLLKGKKFNAELPWYGDIQ